MAKTLDISKSTTSVSETSVPSSSKEESKAKLARFKEKDMEMVQGRFRNLESPGGSAVIPCRKYAGEFFQKELRDGQIYSIPRYVANWLNGYDATASAIDGQVHSCSYVVHGYKTTKDAFPDKNLDEGMTVPLVYKPRYRFESLEFEKAM